MKQKEPLSPDFFLLMEHYRHMIAVFGEDSDQAIYAFKKVLDVSPDWLKQEAFEATYGKNVLPQSSGYADDGTPLYSLEEVSRRLGMTQEQSKKKIDEFFAYRRSKGLPVDGFIFDSSQINRKQ